MKLFAVITTYHYEFSVIRGIYSTLEKAQARKEEVTKDLKLSEDTEIEELELDVDAGN